MRGSIFFRFISELGSCRVGFWAGCRVCALGFRARLYEVASALICIGREIRERVFCSAGCAVRRLLSLGGLLLLLLLLEELLLLLHD